MIKDDLVLDKEPLLIVTRRDPVCTFLSLALLIYRAKRGLYTHITHVDSLLSPLVQDLLQHYEKVLSLDLAAKVEGEIKHKLTKYSIVLETLGDDIFRKVRNIVERDTTALTMIEIAAIMYSLEYGCKPSIEITQLRTVNLPPLPGITYRPLAECLTFSLWPFIPQITGNVEKTQELLSKIGLDPNKRFYELEPSQIDKLLTLIIELYDTDKCSLRELDKLAMPTYITQQSVPVQDLYLTFEAAYALNDIEIIKLREVIRGVKLLQLKSVRDKIVKYLNIVRQSINSALRDEKLTLPSISLALRVFRILKVLKKRNVTIRVRVHENVICYVSTQEESTTGYSSKTVLRLPDEVIIQCMQL